LSPAAFALASSLDLPDGLAEPLAESALLTVDGARDSRGVDTLETELRRLSDFAGAELGVSVMLNSLSLGGRLKRRAHGHYDGARQQSRGNFYSIDRGDGDCAGGATGETSSSTAVMVVL
jgi:hypothetical protein